MDYKRFSFYTSIFFLCFLSTGNTPVSGSKNEHKLKKIEYENTTQIKKSNTIATITCPEDIVVDAEDGACGAVVNFNDAISTGIPEKQQIILTFEGATAQPPVYTELGMRLEAFGRDHIDVPQPIACDNRTGALIHPNTGNTWTYNGGQPFTPDRVFVCTTTMRFATGDCGTEFIPTETGDVDFPDTPEWKNITSMTWEEIGGELDTSIDNFRFTPTSLEQTAGLESGCFFPVGTTPVTYTVTEEDGTQTTCTFNVTVRDTKAPVIIPQTFTTTLDSSEINEITIEDVTESLPTDNCEIDTIDLSQTVFTCADVGNNTVTITVTDTSGNVATATVEVIVMGSTNNTRIDPIDDAITCESFTFPQITGTDLSGEERFYTAPSGGGISFEEGDTVHFEDFSSYPTTLYAYDINFSEECKPQRSFELIIDQSPRVDRIESVETCGSYVFPSITGKNLSGNLAYFTEPNGAGTIFNIGDKITKDAAVTYPITIYAFASSANGTCNNEVAFELDLSVCPLNVTIDASKKDICDNDFTPVILTAVTDPEVPRGNFNYEWRKSGRSSIISRDRFFEVLPSSTTTYEITVVDDGARPAINTAMSTIDITVTEAPVAGVPLFIELCDTLDDGRGVETIDLGTYDDSIKMGDEGLIVTYHSSQEMADAGGEELLENLQLTLGTFKVFARLTNPATSCFDTSSINFELFAAPNIELDEQYALCSIDDVNPTASVLIATGLDDNEFNFEWRLDQGNGFELLEVNQSFIEATTTGEYSVTVTSIDTGCSASTFTTVNSGAAPLSFDATANVSAVFNAHTIRATLRSTSISDGPFEVRLDDGIWFTMNTSSDEFFYQFEGVETGTGIHNVFFRDAAGCWSDQVEVLLIGIPQFFTPNNDGFNDLWNVSGPVDLLNDSQLYIFDRYGKLIQQLQSSNSGWDGTFNGEPLPSSDYWFSLELADGRALKGHFSMKR